MFSFLLCMPYMETHLGIKKLSFFVLLFENVMPETINFTEKFQSVINIF